MKIRKLTIILFVILAAVSSVALLYATRHVILNQVKASIVNKVEVSTPVGMQIDNISYIPLRGFCLMGVSIYKSDLRKQKIATISHIFVQFPFMKYFLKKTFSPTFTVYDFKAGDILANGIAGMEVKTDIEAESPEDALKILKSVWFNNLSVKSPALLLGNVNGIVNVSPSSIKSTDINFTFNGEPCKLNFTIDNPLEQLSSEASISSSKINLISKIKKQNDIYKIEKLEGSVFGSKIDFVGEFGNVSPFILSLYGQANVDSANIANFTSPAIKDRLANLSPEGLLTNSVYFRGQMQDPPAWELGIKSSARRLKVGDVILNDLRIDTRIENGVVNIPLISAYLYKGVLSGSAKFDLRDKNIPYEINCKLSDMEFSSVLEHTDLKGKGVKGTLYTQVSVEGFATDINTMKGPGKIVVTNAELGPMPLLTPLLGHIYGYFQHVFPELKKVNITGGSADILIANRRLSTDNLTLTGDAIGIYAKGYIDFDKNLAFDVENKIMALEKSGDGNGWQTNIQSLIVQFGKMISKARLTGTLKDPKWKFEYFGGVNNIFKGGVKDLIKDIFE